MRLLLTGFEPFGGEAVNPSAEIVRLIAADPPSGVEITVLVLPVRGRVTFDQLVPALDALGLDAWLGVGQAGGRAQLAVERVGINLLIDHDLAAVDARAIQDDVPDPLEQTLVAGAPAAYFARLPVVKLAAHMSAAGAPTAISHSAGAYICNEALYVAEHHLATSGRDLVSGFIHVPYLPEQAASKHTPVPSMALETQLLGVRAAVEFVRDLVAERAAAVGARPTRTT